jgi:glycosyltransferase involved in cell wall biosynthesis
MKTGAALREKGCSVEISSDGETSVEGFDLVHVFGFLRQEGANAQALAAQRRGIPIVLSPIYVDYSEFREHYRRRRAGLQQEPDAGPPHVLRGKLPNGEYVTEVRGKAAAEIRRAAQRWLSMASVLLPNSHSEMRRVERDFPEARGKNYVAVPNAVDGDLFSPAAVEPLKEFQDCILCVARIEGQKGQLELIRALNGTGLKLVLIGKTVTNSYWYYNRIRRELGPQVTLLGQVPHEDLPRYYASCKVHALVSWMETTGFSSLEAGVMGANLVITDKGDAREYFGDLARYCSPDSIDSIRTAIQGAFEAPRSGLLRERILEKYTWSAAAEATLQGYDLALRRQNRTFQLQLPGKGNISKES